MNLKEFWNKNKVFILGLLSSIAIAITPFAEGGMTDETTYKMVGFAVLQATLSWFARNWRGQGLSIVGILGNFSALLATALETGNISWLQIIIQLIVAVSTSAQPDPKSRGYEQADVIKDAKIQGELNVPAALTSAKIKEEVKEIKAAAANNNV